MEFFETLASRTSSLIFIVSSALLFFAIVSCGDNASTKMEEVVAEAKEDMVTASESMDVHDNEEVVVAGKNMVEEVVADADSDSDQTMEKSAEPEEGGSDKPYTVSADGKVDWYTFNGYRRYHSECHVCHGPKGNGSSFAPNLTESVQVLGYEGCLETVVNGRKSVNSVENKNMPSFATNMNVMCYIDDIYAYLVARGDGVVGTTRPPKEAKPEAAKERDNSCSG